MMKNDNPWIELCPGIRRRTQTSGEMMYQMLAELDANCRMPEHSHPNEQIIHILSGRMLLIADGVRHDLTTGDSYYLAANVPHSVETPEKTRVLDTFSPPREEYLAMDMQKGTAG
jgi:quercetin dioxygenase-like cupin family protein